MKKIFALVLALMLVLGMTAAFATDPVKNDKITINNAKAGETYNLYKLFDLKVNDENNPTAFSYTVNSDWADFFTGAGSAYIEKNAAGYITKIKNADGTEATDSKDLATAAAAWANKPTASQTVTVTAPATTAEFTNLADGYYLVTSTLGTFAMAETTPAASAVTINEKNSDDTIEKKVQEDSTEAWGDENDAQVGDTVYFKSKVKVVPRSINVKVHDQMESGLSFNAGSIAIYTDEACTTGLDAAYYTIETTPATTDKGTDTFTISIADSFAATATADQYLYITYNATLTTVAVVVDGQGNPVIDPKTNDTKVTWGNNTGSEWDTTTTTTHKFSVFKHATNSTDNLAGAVFEVKKGSTVLNLTKLNDNNYKIDPAGTVTTFTTVATGDIVIWGVDSDSDYKLHETQPPEGYNALTAEVDVTVDAGNGTRIDVENKSGSQLPATGGIGTTIFYVGGSVLVLAAAILLITKRRMSNND